MEIPHHLTTSTSRTYHQMETYILCHTKLVGPDHAKLEVAEPPTQSPLVYKAWSIQVPSLVESFSLVNHET